VFLKQRACLLKCKTNTVYSSVDFIPLLHSVSSTFTIMTYCIISWLNISFVNRRCNENNYQYEQGMQSGNDATWRCCVLSNLECYTQNHTKMFHYTAGLSSCLVNVTAYILQGVFCIEYEQHADLLTIISMTKAHKKSKSYLPMHNAIFVEKLHS
jgi:hypothetical protein